MLNLFDLSETIEESFKAAGYDMTQSFKDLTLDFVLKHTSSPCVIHDARGEVVYVNPAAENFFGASSNELLTNRKKLSDWTLLDSHGKQLSKEDFPVSFVLENKKNYPPRIIGYRPPDLPVRWCYVKAYPKFDSEGELSLVFVSFTDETKSRNYHKELTEEKQLLLRSEMLLEAGSWSYDIPSQQVNWSENVFNIFGMNSRRGLTYEEYLSLLNDNERGEIIEKVNKAIELAEPYEVVQTINGKTIHSLGIPITDMDGRVSRLNGVLRDITKERARRRKLAELAVVVETTENVVLITDAKGLITWVNQGFVNMTGYTLEEAKGKKPGTLLQGPDTDPKTVEKISQAVKKKEPITTEILNYAKDGRPYWLHISIQPIFNKEGKCISMVAIEFDLSERRETEQQLKKLTSELQDALADRDKFYSILTHDLRSPFNGLIGFTDLIIADQDEMDKSEILELVEQLNHISINTLSMIDEFLCWITSRSGKKEIEPEIINLNSVLEAAKDFYLEIARFKGIEIRCNLTSEIMTKTHKPSIETILRNIIGNSVKFCTKGDSITLDLAAQGEYALLKVVDSGQGMSEKAVSDFKENGGSLSKVGSSGEKGYGLGLALVVDLCKAINSEINLKSEVGKGTEFTIKIPITDTLDLAS